MTASGNAKSIGASSGKSCRFVHLEKPTPDEIEYLGLSDKGVTPDDDIKVWDADDKWVWDGVLEIMSPDGLGSSRGPRLSLVYHSSGRVSYHFSYWARPLHRANTGATFYITPSEDRNTILFRIPWSHATQRHCPNSHESREGTAGYGRNEFDLAWIWIFNLQNVTYWADCKPGIVWEKAQKLTL